MIVSDGILDSHFRSEILEHEIYLDFIKTEVECVNALKAELLYLQKSLSANYQNAIILTLERLNFEVQNALEKHRQNADLPLYNPTLENTRTLINQGLHYQEYQEKLSLNFPLHKRTIYSLTDALQKTATQKKQKITTWIESNKAKLSILNDSSVELESL